MGLIARKYIPHSIQCWKLRFQPIFLGDAYSSPTTNFHPFLHYATPHHVQFYFKLLAFDYGVFDTHG